MAACESPLVENPILIGTLYPWKKQMNPKTSHSLGDIFQDPLPPLFHHIPATPSSSSSSEQPEEEEEDEVCMEEKKEVDEKEEVNKVEEDEEDQQEEEEGMKEAAVAERRQYYYLPPRRIRKGVFWRSRSLGGQFPPPISSISVSSGKPWVYFKSYRRDGRFVLKKIMVPTLELLHASREDGRLRMHFIHRSDGQDQEEKRVQGGLLEEQERDGALP